MKKTVFCTLTALSLALSLTACGGQTTQTPPPARAPPGGATPEGAPPPNRRAGLPGGRGRHNPGDKDYVNSILLTDDSVTTPEGVYIGSSDADVRAAYGEDAGTLSGALCYTKGGTDLNFILEDGKVISIEYLAT